MIAAMTSSAIMVAALTSAPKSNAPLAHTVKMANAKLTCLSAQSMQSTKLPTAQALDQTIEHVLTYTTSCSQSLTIAV
jgi:hypothetical protein